jgi:hypothetical protein
VLLEEFEVVRLAAKRSTAGADFNEPDPLIADGITSAEHASLRPKARGPLARRDRRDSFE